MNKLYIVQNSSVNKTKPSVGNIYKQFNFQNYIKKINNSYSNEKNNG